MTRQDHEAWARKLWDEAYALDPHHTLAVGVAVTGGDVFVWPNLSVRKLRQLSAGLFATARLQ